MNFVSIAKKEANEIVSNTPTFKEGIYLGNGRVNVSGTVYKCRELKLDAYVTITGNYDVIERSKEGKTVLIGFVDKDINKPVILGAIE